MRSFSAEKKGLWTVAAILASAGGMLSKQVMVTAPLIVLLYDYLFISPSLKTALLKRRALYFGLSASWGLLAVTFIASPVNKTAGFSTVGPTPLQYFLSEFRVLVHYLRLAIYPDALAIDYGWKPASGIAAVLPYALPIIALQLATLWGLIKRKPIAFLGAWFFGILAVTSSFMPFSDLAFEHRMYLPLAAVVAAVVLGTDLLLRRWLRARRDYAEKWQRQESFAVLLTVIVLVMGLATLTVRRNMDYKSLFVLWQDTVAKQPENARAQSNLGKALVEKGQLDLAAMRFVEALRYDPEYVEAHHNYGFILLRQGQPEKANYHLVKAIAARPNFPLGHCLLGYDYMALGKLDEAAEHFAKAIDLQPDYTEAYYQLGMVYQQQGQFEKALASYRKALTVDPACLDALNELALLLIHKQAPQLRNPEEALKMAEKSAQISERKYGRSLDALAQVYAELGRYAEALETARQAALSKLAREDREFATGVEARVKDYQEKVTGKTATAKKSGSSS
jgi:tetratricopeptide (TPR) repeat protein